MRRLCPAKGSCASLLSERCPNQSTAAHGRTPAAATWPPADRARRAPPAAPQVLGIGGVDTRAITRRLRVDGCLNGAICTDPSVSDADLLAQCKGWTIVGKDLIKEVGGCQGGLHSTCEAGVHGGWVAALRRGTRGVVGSCCGQLLRALTCEAPRARCSPAPCFPCSRPTTPLHPPLLRR